MAVLPCVTRLSASRSTLSSSLVRTRPLEVSRNKKFKLRKRRMKRRALIVSTDNSRIRLSNHMPGRVRQKYEATVPYVLCNARRFFCAVRAPPVITPSKVNP